MLTIPTASTSISTNRSAPTPACMVWVRVGSAGTGTVPKSLLDRFANNRAKPRRRVAAAD